MVSFDTTKRVIKSYPMNVITSINLEKTIKITKKMIKMRFSLFLKPTFWTTKNKSNLEQAGSTLRDRLDFYL